MNKMAAFMRESSVARILIPMGIILIIFGICMFFINNSNKDYVKTVATVSKVELAQEAYTDPDGNEVDATYTVRVKYTVNNKEYTGVFGELPEYKVGDKLTIYYDPNDPNMITEYRSLTVYDLTQQTEDIGDSYHPDTTYYLMKIPNALTEQVRYYDFNTYQTLTNQVNVRPVHNFYIPFKYHYAIGTDYIFATDVDKIPGKTYYLLETLSLTDYLERKYLRLKIDLLVPHIHFFQVTQHLEKQSLKELLCK